MRLYHNDRVVKSSYLGIPKMVNQAYFCLILKFLIIQTGECGRFRRDKQSEIYQLLECFRA